MALTEKQKRLADEYLIDLNAAEHIKPLVKVKKDTVAAANGSRHLRNLEAGGIRQSRGMFCVKRHDEKAS